MRTLTLVALVVAALLAAAPSRAARSFVEAQAAAGLSGDVFLTETQAGTTFNQDRYRIAARLRTMRDGGAAPGARQEWSASLTRELYHCTITGRLGTSPPGIDRAAYHLAGGEAWFTFYGLTLGPEHPELSAAVWESSGPAPAPESLDRVWVTRVGGVYTNLDDHLEGTLALPALVENVWQLDATETYREDTSVGAEFGFDRLNKEINNRVRVTTKNDIDYLGNVLPVTGWPNNWAGAKASRRVGDFVLTAAGTRLNLLDNALQILYSVQAAWAPRDSGWSLRLGYEHQRARRDITREGVWLGVARNW